MNVFKELDSWGFQNEGTLPRWRSRYFLTKKGEGRNQTERFCNIHLRRPFLLWFKILSLTIHQFSRRVYMFILGLGVTFFQRLHLLANQRNK